MLNPLPAEWIVDSDNRPYFMRELALDQFLKRLEDPQDRPFLIGQLLREARPDDVFSFVSPREILEMWPQIEDFLGRQRAFWEWLLSLWEAQGLVWR
jgi:hypothetical protein